MNTELCDKKFLDILKYEQKYQNIKIQLPNLIYSITDQICFDKAFYLLNLYPEKTAEAKKLYFRAARGAEFNWWWFKNKYKSHRHTKNDGWNMNGSVYNDWTKFLLSDAKEYFFFHYKSILNESVEKKMDNYGNAMAFAFLYMLDGQKELALEKMGKHYKKGTDFYRGFCFVVAGILENDVSLCNYGIEYHIDFFRSINRDLFRYNAEATALAKLAQMFGMAVDISHPYINKQMLEFEKLEYEDIDFLFDSLGVEPLVRHKLTNY